MIKRTIYTLPKDTDPEDGKILKVLIDVHKADIETFATLESYVDDAPVMTRESPNELLTINNFAQYITSINTGYLLGNPVDYKDSGKAGIDPIVENYNGQNIAELDTELEEDCSMFGQAFENVFVDETSTATSAKLSVYNTIVVYDTTFKHNKMYAIYYAPQIDSNNIVSKERFDITIWTKDKILYRVLNKETLEEDANQPDADHYFGEVPVVHYLNNRRMKGDYEPVISLIDAYNILQSDRVIDREKLVDAILAFYGSKLTADDQKAIKDNRVVGLPDGAKAEYIVKNVDEMGADVLRKTLAADIHKFSMTPDLTDESFGNSPSGVALLYKLLAFENNVKSKERLFEAGLMNRFTLYVAVLGKMSKLKAIDIKTVDTVFKRSLPKNNFETSQMINNLDGLVSKETLVGQLDFVTDASAEVEKVDAEAPATDFATDNFKKEVVK